jgi:uncharacterized membrane protein
MDGFLGRPIALLAAILLLAAVIDAGSAAQVTDIVIEVAETGSATVSMTIAYNQGEVLVAVPTIGRPDAFTIKATGADGTKVPFTSSGGQLILTVVGVPSPVKLQYQTDTLTSKTGRVWNITLQLAQAALLRLPRGAVLVGISGVPEDITRADDRFIIILPPGEWVISYFLVPAAAETPAFPALSPLWLLAILALGGGAAGYVVLSRRRRAYILRPDDRRILEYISAVGGQAYESDIVRELNLPKSTVWRAVRRLSHANLVTIVREGNRVKVVRK